MEKENKELEQSPTSDPPNGGCTKIHIAIARFSALGDIAMTIPIIDSLARQHQEVAITVLSRPYVADLFKCLPPNISFLPLDLKGKDKGIKGMWNLSKKLKRCGITHYADLHSVLRTRMLRFFLFIRGIKTEGLIKDRKGRRLFLKHQISKSLSTPFELYTQVFTRLGFDIDVNFISLNLPYNECFNSKLQQLIPKSFNQDSSIHNEPIWIGVAPFAAHKGKIYPTPLLLQSLMILQEKFKNVSFFIFGTANEMLSIKETWRQKIQHIYFVHETFSGFEEELQLMSKLDTMISMDSGNMHLASLVALPVVSIWGQTHPNAGFLGWKQSTKNIIQLDLDCRPCSIFGNRPCKWNDLRCLYRIDPKQVAKEVIRVIREKRQN